MNFDPEPGLREARDQLLVDDEPVLWEGAPDERYAAAHAKTARAVAAFFAAMALFAVVFIVVWFMVLAPRFGAAGGGGPAVIATVIQTCGGLVGMVFAGLALAFARGFWRIADQARRLHERVLYTLTDRRAIILMHDHRTGTQTQEFDASAIEGFTTRPGPGGATDLVFNGVGPAVVIEGGRTNAPGTREVGFLGLADAGEAGEVLQVLIEAAQRGE